MLLILNHYDLQPRVALAELRLAGWDGLRRNVHSTEEPLILLAQHADTYLGLLALVDELPGPHLDALVDAVASATVPASIPWVVLEIGNEWDRKGVSPELALATWVACAQRWPKLRIVTAGVASLSNDGRAWLQEATANLPPELGVSRGIHSYQRDAPKDLYAGMSGAWCTEVGWHTAPVSRSFPLCWLKSQLSDDDVLARLLLDAEHAHLAGLTAWTVYQVIDGPTNTSEDRFGLYTVEGRAKRQAQVASLISSRLRR